ncbi:MAG TPA: hypothetical protein EYP73_04445 [Acidimicrobiia bacterium]|nr:hypothetical protein [Acidimicrobiia bacterium]
MRKVLAAVVAGAILVGAGFVTAAVAAPGAAVAQESEAPATEASGFIPRALSFLGGVLDDLVAEGTITVDQADAVLRAVEAKMEATKAERETLREMIKGFLEDGVMTEDEAAQLPEDHFLLSEKFDEAWADGELTIEEIRELMPHPRRDAFRRGARLGALLDGGGIDQAEYDALPEDHPLKQIDVSSYLEDGIITLPELREIWRQHRAQAGQDS